MRTKNNLCKVTMVPLLPWSLVRWYPQKYLHLQSQSSAKSTWYQPMYLVRWPQAQLSKLELAGQRQNFANLFYVRLLHLLYLLYTLHICILHLLRLETATTNKLLSGILMHYKRNSVMFRSDQIRKERLFKIVECKDFALANQQARHPPPKYGFVDFSRLSQPPPFPPRPASVAKLGKVTKYRAKKSFSVGNLYHGK